MTYLETYECVSSVTNITPVLKVEGKTMINMGILLVIYDGVYACICKVYSSVFTQYTKHTFVYDSHFSTLEKSECCGEIIDRRSYAPICLLEGKDRNIKYALKNILRKFFDGTFIVEYSFKATVNYFYKI